MNKIQLETRVNEIVNHVIAGGKVEDDHVEAKREWPKLDKAAQLAGMANAAGGYPILWIIGLCEGSKQVIPLDDTDPASWWQQIKGGFAYGVTPSLTTLRVVTDHGSVMALLFETDQAPYLVSLPKVPRDPDNPASGFRWATAAVPWREGTSNRTATRAELLSLLRDSAAAPDLAVVTSVATLFDEIDVTVPPPPMDLSFFAVLLIDTEPGVHTFFPVYRQQITLTTSTGVEVDCSEAQFATSAAVRPADPHQPASAFLPRQKEFNPYGATDRPSGLVVMAPDVVRMQVDLEVPRDDAQEMSQADWVELTVHLPIGASERVAKTHHRLLRVKDSGEKESTSFNRRRVTAWATNGAIEHRKPPRWSPGPRTVR
ncbi:AlbA family DNA-binding domain-containing protein [Nocardia ignorata]|uniref:Uncharacterized protein n=1 Tax=Nocardia ignorata TaxID=145285 RepID=A0A4V3CMK2_NOCIG|nr:hypothetical protein [Nocardia ignorata]TDP29874.1 hypothetical protein DFR75_112143 [Nocardia ignorata]